MQRISTWTVFKGEPVFFQAASEGCGSSRTPGADVPSSLNATPRPSPPAPSTGSAALARGAWGGPPGQAAVPRGRGAWCLVCGFWVSLCRETTAPFSLFRDARRILREEDGRTPRAGSVVASFILAHP